MCKHTYTMFFLFVIQRFLLSCTCCLANVYAVKPLYCIIKYFKCMHGSSNWTDVKWKRKKKLISNNAIQFYTAFWLREITKLNWFTFKIKFEFIQMDGIVSFLNIQTNLNIKLNWINDYFAWRLIFFRS